MRDVRDLQMLQIDALKEVGNIGGGHAATASDRFNGKIDEVCFYQRALGDRDVGRLYRFRK